MEYGIYLAIAFLGLMSGLFIAARREAEALEGWRQALDLANAALDEARAANDFAKDLLDER